MRVEVNREDSSIKLFELEHGIIESDCWSSCDENSDKTCMEHWSRIMRGIVVDSEGIKKMSIQRI